MKRITVLSALLACGLIATAIPTFAQDDQTPAPKTPQTTQPPTPGDMPQAAVAPVANWFAGNVNMVLLGRDDVASSKFEEYRSIPKGVSLPVFNIAGNHNGNSYKLLAERVSQPDQRYQGFVNANKLGVKFDYNQIPHNMGNSANSILIPTTPTQWTMSDTLRQTLGATVDAVLPTANRTYPFYSSLLGPTIDSAGQYDLSGQRKRADIVVDFAKSLQFTYNRDYKSGWRGASSGDILSVVTTTVDVLEPMDEVTQDIGVRWVYNVPKKGNIHASFNRNMYDDRLTSLTLDNPFRATDLAFVSTSVPGGPAQVLFSTPPDNQANRGAFGAQYRFAHQTLVTADLAFGQWTQNAQFLPYTINSVVLTGSGQPANSVGALQQQSLNGKIDTASYNFTFASRPADALSVRMRYRNYSYKDKSNRFVITGDLSSAPDRSWGAADAPTADDPYGRATANRTDSSLGHFEGQLAYDIGDLTLEGVYRNIKSSWVGRQASSGTDDSENGYVLSAVYHSRDWLAFRARFDQGNRKVTGVEAGSVAAVQGVMYDHAERKRTGIGFNIELTPASKFDATFSYGRRKDDYPNRPFEVANDPRTESGLLVAQYDTFTADLGFHPNERTQITGFYTYEKNEQTNQWVTLTSGAVNNLLTYVPKDTGNSYGLNGVFQLVPEKWTLNVLAQYQYVNGFEDITALETGSFYTPGRETLISAGQGGAAAIGAYDDTKLTTAMVDLGYTFAKAWTFTGGYAYERYRTADAYSDGTTIFPQSVFFFLKANNGNYNANVAYTRLSYRF